MSGTMFIPGIVASTQPGQGLQCTWRKRNLRLIDVDQLIGGFGLQAQLKQIVRSQRSSRGA